jgi:hypothetical protein
MSTGSGGKMNAKKIRTNISAPVCGFGGEPVVVVAGCMLPVV